MDRKEIIIVFVLALLVLLAGTANLFSTPPPPPAERTGLDPLRAIAPLLRDKDAGKRPPMPLWPTLARNLRPQDPGAARLLDAAETIASEGVLDAAIAAYERFTQRFPRGHAAEFARLRVAQCYTLDGKYDDAREKYEQFLTKHPGSGYRPLALLWSADALMRRGYRERARKRLDEVIARHPMSPFAEGAKTLLGALNSAPSIPPRHEPEAPAP